MFNSKIRTTLFLFLAVIGCTVSTAGKLTRLVDPFIGAGGHGHVFVGACLPYGNITIGPNQLGIGWDWSSGYHYSDSTIYGFGQMHLSGTGCSDLGDLPIMPVVGDVKMNKGEAKDYSTGFFSKFSHQNEACRPGFYSVLLSRYNVKAEMTAGKRVSLSRYTFQRGADARIILNLTDGVGWRTSATATDAQVHWLNDTTLIGYRFSKEWANNKRTYFVVRFSRPMTKLECFRSDKKVKGTSVDGKNVYAQAYFDTKNNSQVLVKVALSAVDEAGAVANLNSELNDWNFTKTMSAADEAWESSLKKVQADFPSEKQQKIFYTALYHTMIAPMLFCDANKDYRGADDKIHRNADFTNYTTFSLWDTYRAVHPLASLIHPDMQRDWAETFVHIYQQQGYLPIWPLAACETGCMVGSPAVPVLADMCLKGYVKDEESAYQAMKNSMFSDIRGLQYMKTLGYIPSDKTNESVSMNLENYLAFWSVAQVARKLGKDADYKQFMELSKGYEKIYNPQVSYFNARLSDGKFKKLGDFNPNHQTKDFTEGNPWQYLWLVPHDVKGLIHLLGGDNRFEIRLDSLFTASSNLNKNANPDIAGLIGQYAHGNEPSHHICYLYNYVGKPWKAANRLRQVMKTLYYEGAEGTCGNEDVGQMSAWYVLSALGLYQVEPCGGKYVFGSPIVKVAEIDLGNGKKLLIEAPDNDDATPYIQSVEWNGEPYGKSYIDFKTLQEGGTLKFNMGFAPSNFGTSPEDRP